MLGSVRATGTLPGLGHEPLGWLPVDVAAEALIEVIESMAKHGPGGQQAQIYHLLNDDQKTTWQDLLAWAKTNAEGKVELLPPAEWVRKMEVLQKERPDHPALALLGLWKNAYGDKEEDDNETQHEAEAAEADGKTGGRFETSKTKEVTRALRELNTLDQAYFERIWHWIMENVDE